ncbi:MAG: hypothetical protein ACRDD1_00775, partial [Planctomycetia bacterium]
IEELLDRIVETGFLSMGDLRDALSRSNLKLPDVAGVGDLAFGDALLRLNDRLAQSLRGVYHRGEVYLRWLHTFSALGFGTPFGRLLTKNVALPFGGAFVLLEGAQHILVEPVEHLFHVHAPYHLNATWPALFWTGLFLYGLLYLPLFRSAVWNTFVLLGRSLRLVFHRIPLAVWNSAPLRALRASWAYRQFMRWLLRPARLTVAAYAVLDPRYGGTGVMTYLLWLVFGVVFVLTNSRPGRVLEEAVVDWSIHAWQQFRATILLGLAQWVVEQFKRAVERVEQWLYAIDEAMLFRPGESWLVRLLKPPAAVAWAGVRYVVRFCIVLLVEPQINPIKHFPVVTVGHKLLWPMLPALIGLFETTFGFDKEWSVFLALGIINGCPGIFGFFVWELKENWKLFEANRAKELHGVRIGGHGETMTGLLRPGFHSGTLPNLFRRLRRARRAVARGRVDDPTQKPRIGLHHAHDEILHFLDREFVRLLADDRLAGSRVGLVAVDVASLATNRIVVVLRPADDDRSASRNGPANHSAGPAVERSVSLTFEDQGGVLAATVVDHGWLVDLPPAARRRFLVALAGLCKLCQVEVVRGAVERSLPAKTASSLHDRRWVVEPIDGAGPQASYALDDPGELSADGPPGPFVGGLPTLDADRVLLRNVPIAWTDWVLFWEHGAPNAAFVEAATTAVAPSQSDEAHHRTEAKEPS